MVMEAVLEDMGEGTMQFEPQKKKWNPKKEGTMQCLDHPYKNHNPGGICAFYLQNKLGKLVSSSFPIAIFPSSSSSPSSSFRFDSTLSVRQNTSTNSTITMLEFLDPDPLGVEAGAFRATFSSGSQQGLATALCGASSLREKESLGPPQAAATEDRI